MRFIAIFLLTVAETTEEYRRWCQQNLPDWLGYGRI
jgi:hypothetical protein